MSSMRDGTSASAEVETPKRSHQPNFVLRYSHGGCLRPPPSRSIGLLCSKLSRCSTDIIASDRCQRQVSLQVHTVVSGMYTHRPHSPCNTTRTKKRLLNAKKRST